MSEEVSDAEVERIRAWHKDRVAYMEENEGRFHTHEAEAHFSNGKLLSAIDRLRARIKDLESAQEARVPEGWVLVPKETTEAMRQVAMSAVLEALKPAFREYRWLAFKNEWIEHEFWRVTSPTADHRERSELRVNIRVVVQAALEAMLAAAPPAPSAPTDQGAIKRAIESAIHFAEGVSGGEDQDGNTIFPDDLLTELYAALTEVCRIGGERK